MKKTFNFLGSLLLFATIVTSCSQDEIFKSEGNEQGVSFQNWRID